MLKQTSFHAVLQPSNPLSARKTTERAHCSPNADQAKPTASPADTAQRPFDVASQGYAAAFHSGNGQPYREALYFTGWKQSAQPQTPVVISQDTPSVATWSDFADQASLYSWRPWHINAGSPLVSLNPGADAQKADVPTAHALVQSMASFNPSTSTLVQSAATPETPLAQMLLAAIGQPTYLTFSLH